MRTVMISKYCYLTPVQTLFLKGFAILCIMSHNFFHWVPPVTYENEMHFYPMYFSRFLQDFTWPDAINCLFSFWGFYGVYLFIFLSGYGLTKSFANHHTERNIRFIGRHIAKIYLLFLCSAALYLFIVPKVNYRAVLHVLSLTTNLSPETLFLVCGPWWFFSLIIQLYLLFLFLYKFIQKDISNIVLICFSYLLINSLEFFINSFNFCRGKRGVFLCTATECRRGWQRKATGCQGLWRRVSGTAGSCGEPCADGQPGRLCGRAGALTGFQRGVDNNQQLAGTGDDSGHF